MTDIAEIAKGLSEAQRRAVATATWREQDGAWHPEGWYCSADKRVRYRLCTAGLTRDYLRHSNRLTPLGHAVRAHLQEASHVR